MRRTVTDRRTDRGAHSCDGGEAVTLTLSIFLIVSATLFCIGLLAVLSRRHAIFILIGIEMMLAAAILIFITLFGFGLHVLTPTGIVVDIFSIAFSAPVSVVAVAMVSVVDPHC